MPWKKKGASCFAMYGFAVSVHPNGTQTRTSNQYEPLDDLTNLFMLFFADTCSLPLLLSIFAMVSRCSQCTISALSPPSRRLLPRVHLPSARLIFPTALKKGEYWQRRGGAIHLSHEHTTKKFGGNAETIGFRILCARSNPDPTAGRSVASGYFAVHSPRYSSRVPPTRCSIGRR